MHGAVIPSFTIIVNLLLCYFFSFSSFSSFSSFGLSFFVPSEAYSSFYSNFFVRARAPVGDVTDMHPRLMTAGGFV
ncbi:hypothetical protein BGW36DRAFT_380959, partial [Talaromyces proteolyticus]